MMDTLYIAKDAKLEREDYTLVVKTAGSPKRRIPIHAVENIVIAGEGGLTTALLTSLGRDNVRVIVLDWHGNVCGTFEPFGRPRSGAVHLAQAAHVADPAKRLAVATEIVCGAIRNIKANLRYRAYRGAPGLGAAIEAISAIQARLSSAVDIAVLMGHEGSARAWYYGAWKEISPELDFGPRRRRPPNNRVNCLISWFNGLAYSLTMNEIAKTHLDGCLSFLHSPTEARHSLALDVSELFKPAVVDTLIFEIALRNLWRDQWFVQDLGVCRLAESGRRETLEMWTRKIERADVDGVAWRDLIRREAFKIERHVLGVEPYAAFVRKV